MTDTPSVSAQFRERQDGGLDAIIEFANPTSQALYVLNRLWTLDDTGKLLKERLTAYSLLSENGTLVLLLGLAPMPRQYTPFYQNVPHATAVKPNSILSTKHSLSSPVQEYNPYFVNDSAEYETKTAQAIKIVVDYFAEWPELQTLPSPLYEGAVIIQSPEMHERLQSVSSPAYSMTIKVERRTDYFERLTEVP